MWVFVAALVVLTLLAPPKVTDYFTLVDWPTIATLLGLMILVKGIERSGWLHRAGHAIVRRLSTERQLALFLVAGSALCAMVVTNDITLFVVVPLTLGLAAFVRLPTRRLVIFEALAVNAGSFLSPIGNPRNIFLWQHSRMNFETFVVQQFEPFLIVLFCLIILTVAAFPARRFVTRAPSRPVPLHRPLLVTSALLFAPFLVLTDLHFNAAALFLVAVVFLFAFPRLLRRLDWPLLAVFVLMFVDMGLIARYDFLRGIALADPETLYVTGALVSQFISDTPTAILLARHTSDWAVLGWAVNVGAFGTVVASFANLIALRLGRQRGSYLAFHAWSLPFFVVVGGFVWLWLRF